MEPVSTALAVSVVLGTGSKEAEACCDSLEGTLTLAMHLDVFMVKKKAHLRTAADVAGACEMAMCDVMRDASRHSALPTAPLFLQFPEL